MWMASNEDGDKIVKLDREKLIGKSPLINMNIVTGELEFKSDSISYPCDFTILCGSKVPGEAGEGTFDITAYAQDEKM